MYPVHLTKTRRQVGKWDGGSHTKAENSAKDAHSTVSVNAVEM